MPSQTANLFLLADLVEVSTLPGCRLASTRLKIELVDSNHNVLPGQVVTLTFAVPDYDRAKVYGHGH
jgi:hypothetical protein